MFTDISLSYCAIAFCITSVYYLSHMKQEINQSTIFIRCLPPWTLKPAGLSTVGCTVGHLVM